jgi:hypothetical protein
MPDPPTSTRSACFLNTNVSPVVIQVAENHTYDSGDFMSGFIKRNPNGANRSDTFPSATSFTRTLKGCLGLSDFSTVNTFVFYYTNTSSQYSVTLNGGSGITMTAFSVGPNTTVEGIILVNTLSSIEIHFLKQPNQSGFGESLLPSSDATLNIGSPALRWRWGYFTNLSAPLLSLTSDNILSIAIYANPPVASVSYEVPDVGTNATFVLSEGTQTINGNKTFSGSTTIGDSTKTHIVNGYFILDSNSSIKSRGGQLVVRATPTTFNTSATINAASLLIGTITVDTSAGAVAMTLPSAANLVAAAQLITGSGAEVDDLWKIHVTVFGHATNGFTVVKGGASFISGNQTATDWNLAARSSRVYTVRITNVGSPAYNFI